MHKISFVIPTLNEGKAIEGTLKCLLEYGGPKEIIVSDGASKDDTVAIAKRYGAKAVVHEHGGVFGISYENFEKVQGLFREYHDRILLISKVTIGFGMALATLIVAGATRVPFTRIS